MYDQRVACGWKSDEVPSYVEFAKKGKRVFYWVVSHAESIKQTRTKPGQVLARAVVDWENLLEIHAKAYPKVGEPLHNPADPRPDSMLRKLPRWRTRRRKSGWRRENRPGDASSPSVI